MLMFLMQGYFKSNRVRISGDSIDRAGVRA